jgi:hypothetical protein
VPPRIRAVGVGAELPPKPHEPGGIGLRSLFRHG